MKSLRRNDIVQNIGVLVPKSFDMDLLKGKDQSRLEEFYDAYVKEYKKSDTLDSMYPVETFYKQLVGMLALVFCLLFFSYKDFYKIIVDTTANEMWLNFFKIYYENIPELSFVISSFVSLIYVSLLKFFHERDHKDISNVHNDFNLALAHRCLENLGQSDGKGKSKGNSNRGKSSNPLNSLNQLRDNVKFLQNLFADDLPNKSAKLKESNNNKSNKKKNDVKKIEVILFNKNKLKD